MNWTNRNSFGIKRCAYRINETFLLATFCWKVVNKWHKRVKLINLLCSIFWVETVPIRQSYTIKDISKKKRRLFLRNDKVKKLPNNFRLICVLAGKLWQFCVRINISIAKFFLFQFFKAISFKHQFITKKTKNYFRRFLSMEATCFCYHRYGVIIF